MWNKIQHRFHSPDAIVSLILGIGVCSILGVIIVNASLKKTSSLQNHIDSKNVLAKQIPTTYIVKDGDTLWYIAMNYYKSGYNWITISDANLLANPNIITVGQLLKLPNAPTIEVGQISSTSTERIYPKDKSYVVKNNDTLWSISTIEYGSPDHWNTIAIVNTITHPDLIYPETILKLEPVDIFPNNILPQTTSTL